MPDKAHKNDITLSIKVVYDEEVIKEKYKDKAYKFNYSTGGIEIYVWNSRIL